MELSAVISLAAHRCWQQYDQLWGWISPRKKISRGLVSRQVKVGSCDWNIASERQQGLGTRTDTILPLLRFLACTGCCNRPCANSGPPVGLFDAYANLIPPFSPFKSACAILALDNACANLDTPFDFTDSASTNPAAAILDGAYANLSLPPPPLPHPLVGAYANLSPPFMVPVLIYPSHHHPYPIP